MLADIDAIPVVVRVGKDNWAVRSLADPGWLAKREPTRLARGFYTPATACDLGCDILGLLPPHPAARFEKTYPSLAGGEPRGVADDVGQILARYADDFAHPERTFVVGVNEVLRADQPPTCGWRWRNWGPYIGTRAPRREYLYDEKDIDRVLAYRVYEISVPEAYRSAALSGG